MDTMYEPGAGESTDLELGRIVAAHLIELGLETPALIREGHLRVPKPLISCRAQEDIEYHVRQILDALGLDLNDDSLKETPKRVAKMMVCETFKGLDYTNFPKCTTIANKMHSKDEFILEHGIQVNSVCEHHLVTIDGRASVAYIPKEKVLGLSKLNRIVDFFSRRPQVQERLTHQIAEAISTITGAPDVAVQIDAVHYCVKARGIRDVSSRTVTFAGLGRFGDVGDAVRREFVARRAP